MHRRVAIIAYSLRFPGTDIHRFWNDLLAKKDLVTEVDPSRWPKETFLHPDKRHPGASYTFAAGSLGDISGFDAAFFGISPREAVLIDPQQRLLLELTWETLENAGILPSSLRGSDCGAYIGISNVDYAYRLADDMPAVKAAAATGLISSIAANRISYVFDLHGPSIAMDTACSSSLVAFHQACLAIRSGEISQALAGGINLHLHPYGFISFSKATMLSKTGRCHVFDEAGDGYVRSEGGGLFLLKDYEQALADGDPILAVVVGSAINTDGHKSGLTIPNPVAQAELMSRVYRLAGINPDAIDYFEAHGTGTAVGDPIEAHAIGLALGQQRQQPLLIGSVKSNLGHLESASGVAGLVKALNCIRHRAVPATISAKRLNPNIKLDEWNLRIVTETQSLKPKGELIVGINSFGFGGANAHVILKSHALKASTRKKALPAPSSILPIIVSGKDDNALKQAAADMADYLDQTTPARFYDSAYSAFFHRDRHPHAAIVFSDNAQQAAEQLRLLSCQEHSAPASQEHIGTALAAAKGPVFVYSGNGCQWQGMGRQLLTESAIFRETLAEIDALFSQYADFSLTDELSGNNGDGDTRYDYTEVAQPALFAVQVGITQLLKSYGVTPAATLGHSVGEVAAAWAAGALSLPQAVKVIYFRSHHQGKTKGLGGMTAVGLGAAEISGLLAMHGLNQLSIAGINSHRGTTIAGDAGQLTLLEAKLSANNAFCKRLPLDYAFHSPMMEGIESGICEDLAGLKPSKPELPFFSTVTGGPMTDATLNADYWWHNIRQPVLFQQAVEALIAEQFNVFVEIGSHPVLHSYLNDSLKASEQEGISLNTLTKTSASLAHVQHSLAKIMMSGVPFNYKFWFPAVGRFVHLPNYPWQREKLWHPVTSESHGLLARKKVHPLLGYPLAQQDLTWENQLDTQLQPFLADHNVGGAVVFPGAGFAELALAAAHHCHATDFIEIEELEIRTPLVLGHDQTKLIRFKLDANDGRFTLRSREYAHSSEWQIHCLGRVLNDATGNKLKLKAPELPSRTPDFSRADHIALTQSVDLDYGPAFQALSHGWAEADRVVGILAIPDGIRHDLGDYYLHPSLLDCTFQLAFQILKEHLHQHEDTAFVPVKIGRLNLRCCKTTPAMATAKLLHKLPHSLKAEFALYDSEGHAIALLQNVRFRAVRLHRQQNRGLSYLDYHLTPAPLKQPTPLILNATLFASLGVQAAEAAQRYSLEVEPLLDSLHQRNITGFFIALADRNGLVKAADIAELSARHSGSDTLLSAMLAYAVNNQILSPTTGLDWQLSQEALREDIPKAAIWNILIQEYPDYSLLAQLAGRVSLHWDNLVKGLVQPAAVGIVPALYGKISSHILEQTGKKALLDALQEQYRQLLENLPYGGRLKILEIGNYKPEFAPLLCPIVDFRQTDVYFASFCEQALDAAIGLREHFPALQTLALKALSEPPRVVDKATLTVIHLNQGDIEETRRLLGLLPDLLEPGSPVLLVGLNPARWIDGILGFSKQLGGHEGSPAHSPQLSANAIAEQLASQSFGQIQIHEWVPEHASGHYLIAASAPVADQQIGLGTVENGNWLILADEEPGLALATQIAQHLRQHGQHATLASTPAVLDDYQQIIHLSGFGQARASSQSRRCGLAGRIIQTLEKGAANNTRLWLITQGVGALWPCDQQAPEPNPQRAGQIAHDAALWGFGRTLMNEASNYQVRLLDINGDCQEHRLMAAIVTELLAGNRQEIVLTQGGRRFAPRLRNEPAPTMPCSVPSESAARDWRLGFKLPGQLRNLQWQAIARATPADDDIEVAVQATGLNFRDVMYTLGLLSDEAVENGFVGASLGLEFAGTVTCVGATITTFKPGDQVAGLGPASFSNRVLAKANTVTLIPDGINPAAAATIPSTFFTVYYALLHQARLQPGEKILIHGAAGGVGIAAIQVARWLGAEIYATVGSEEKRDFLRLLGVEHIHDSRSLSFAEEILAKTGNRGVDVVLNSLAGEAINRNFQVLKPFGRFLELGKRDFYENTAIGLRPFRNNISYFGIDADQLMQERPELTQKLFAEMMQLFHAGVLHPLPYTVFDANQVADAFRFMQQAKQIGKVVVIYPHGIHAQALPALPKKPTPLFLSDQASYLITGGLSGFGLRTAQWLIEKGARHLILLGRSGPSSDEAKAALAEWSKQGVNAHAVACDVADKAALSLLLDQCATDMPPLKGLIHAAAVIDDGLVRNLTEKQLDDVLQPKIQGALNLHELTLEKDLDFFILYSSVTTLFGNPGQANYVAGNLWLEALAAHRCQQGLPATCIRWGALDDTGFLARNPKIKEALKNRMGGHAMASTEALAVLENLLATDRPTVGVMEFDWRALSNFLPTARSDKFAELTVHSANSDHGDDHLPDLQHLLEELSDDELQATFVDMLKEELSQILLVNKDKINADHSMYDMGLDSLMGVELMVAIESRFNVQVPVMALSEAPTLNKLANRLITQLRGDNDMQHNEMEVNIHDLSKRHGSGMSDEQLSSLVKELESNKDTKIFRH